MQDKKSTSEERVDERTTFKVGEKEQKRRDNDEGE